MPRRRSWKDLPSPSPTLREVLSLGDVVIEHKSTWWLVTARTLLRAAERTPGVVHRLGVIDRELVARDIP